MSNRDYRALDVAKGLAENDPLAVAFDAISRIMIEVPPDKVLPILANVVAFALAQQQTVEMRIRAMAMFMEMLTDCLRANRVDRPEGMTLQ